MKIHDCIKKAGKALDKEDRNLLLKNLPEKVKSLGEQAGSEAVIDDLLVDLQLDRQALKIKIEDEGGEVPDTQEEEDAKLVEEEQTAYQELLAQKERDDKAWRDSIPKNAMYEERLVEPNETKGKKPLTWNSRTDAMSYARAYGFDNAEVLETQEITGEFGSTYALIYKTNRKNKRYLSVKNGHGFVTLAERDRIWLGWEQQIKDNAQIGGGRMILSLFDRTGTWSQAYVDTGYDVVQIDVDHPLWAMDIRDLNAQMLIDFGWENVHGILAAPPCQHFSNACRGLWQIKDKDGRTRSGLELLDHLGAMVQWLQPDFHAIENPAQSRINKPGDFDAEENLDLSTVEWLGEESMKFNPNLFGDDYTKNTKLWGEFNEGLPEANVFPAQGSRIWKLTGYTKKQKQERSITPVGFSNAFFIANSPLSEAHVNMEDWLAEIPYFDNLMDYFGNWAFTSVFIRDQVRRGRTLDQMSKIDLNFDNLPEANVPPQKDDLERVNELVEQQIEKELSPKARIKKLFKESEPYVTKKDLTAEEADEYKRLQNEIIELQFEDNQPIGEEDITVTNDLNDLSADIIAMSYNAALTHKGAYVALHQAAVGVDFNADTSVDDVLNNKNKEIGAQQLYDLFEPVRERLNEEYGYDILLYRAVGKQKDKPTTNWSTTEKFAKNFGEEIITKRVPVSQILAIVANKNGKYHEVIVVDELAKYDIQEPTYQTGQIGATETIVKVKPGQTIENALGGEIVIGSKLRYESVDFDIVSEETIIAYDEDTGSILTEGEGTVDGIPAPTFHHAKVYDHSWNTFLGNERVEAEKKFNEIIENATPNEVSLTQEEAEPEIELTGEETPLQKRQREKRERDAAREEVPVEAGAGDLFAGTQTPDLFPGTTLEGETQTPEQELADLQTEYDRVTIERGLPFPEQRKIAEKQGTDYQTYRDISLEDQKRRRRRIVALKTKIEGGTERLSLDETPAELTRDEKDSTIIFQNKQLDDFELNFGREVAEEKGRKMLAGIAIGPGFNTADKTSQTALKAFHRHAVIKAWLAGEPMSAFEDIEKTEIQRALETASTPEEVTDNWFKQSELQKIAQSILQKTNGNPDVTFLAGPALATLRQELMEILTGKKPPKAKSGITILRKTAMETFGIEHTKGSSIAEREEKLRQAILDSAKYGEQDLTEDELLEEYDEKIIPEREAQELHVGDEVGVLGDVGVIVGISGDNVQFRAHRVTNPKAYNNVPKSMVTWISTPPNSKGAFSKAVDELEPEEIEVGMEKGRMMKLLGEKMYTYSLGEVVIKELIQNSFDASKAAILEGLVAEANIDVSIDYPNRTIIVKDNAKGMSASILKKAFFTIGGTDKSDLPIEDRSGGLGLAKVGFMLNADELWVRTTQKGSNRAITVKMTTRDIELQRVKPTYEDADIDEHGTEVRVKIPESRENEDGEQKSYGMPWNIDNVNFFDKPLIHPGVVVTAKATGFSGDIEEAEIVTLKMGKNFDDTNIPKLTGIVFPDWGTAEVYFGVLRDKEAMTHVLSAGVYQFSYASQLRKGESIPYDIIVDVRSSVPAEHSFYPFANSRESWSPNVEEDIKLLQRYLAKTALGGESKILQENMNNIVSMPLVSDEDAGKALTKRKAAKEFKQQQERPALTPEEQAAHEEWAEQWRKQRELESELTMDKEGNLVDKEGNEVVENEEEYQRRKKQEVEKKKEGKMEADVDAPDVGEFMDVMIQDPKLPIFHNNTNLDVIKIGREHGSPEQLFSEIGTIFIEMKEQIANSGIWTMDGMKAENLFYAGISIDKGYGGLHIKLPYKAVFLNPLYAQWNDETLFGTRASMISTMIHELAHQANMGHNQSHNTAMTKILIFLEDSGMMDYYRDSLLKTLGRHSATYKAMRDEYDKSTTKNVGKSFKDYDESSESASDGGTESDLGNRSESVQEGERTPDAENVPEATGESTTMREPRGVFEESRTVLSDEQVEGILGDDPNFSVARTRSDGIGINEAKDAVSQALGKKLASRIDFYETLEDIPDKVLTSGRQLMSAVGQSVGDYQKVEGFVLGKKAYLITKNLDSVERAVWVAWHEMWHRGAKVRYGVQFNRALRKAGTNNVVKRLAHAIKQQRKSKDRWGEPQYISEMESLNEALSELNAAMRTKNYAHLKTQYGITVPQGMKSGWRAMVQGWIDAIKNIMRRTSAYLSGNEATFDTEMTDLQISNMVRGIKLNVKSNINSPSFSIVHEGAKMPRPESEERWIAAGKGYTPITMRQWVSEHVTDVKDGFSRHFINLPNTPQFAEVAEQLRKVEAAPEAARDAVLRMMKLVTGNMTPQDLDLFTRKVVLDDLSYEITMEHDLPMDLTPDEVHETLSRIDAILEERPDIQEAVETRRILVQNIAAKLVEAGVLTENEIQNPYYYRHQVLDYMHAESRYGMQRNAIRTPKRASRKGSLKDINVNYLEVEFEWLNKALVDIEIANTLEWVKSSIHNARSDAVEAGREQNRVNFEGMLATDLAVNGYDVISADGERVLRRTSPLNEEALAFNRRIAMGINEIASSLDERSFDIPERYSQVAYDLMNDVRSRNPMFYEFLGFLADNGMEGSAGAKMVFSAINQRKAWKRELLGEGYVNTQSMDELVRKGFAPEGYVTWQPDKGRLLYTAHTLSDHIVSNMIAKMSENPNGLSAEDAEFMTTSVRNILAVGGPKFQMIIPEELAKTLDSLHDEDLSSKMGIALRAALTQWKRWQLVSPWRFLKYNINNFSGDIDAVIAIGPKILTKFPKAVAELTNVMFRGATPSPAFTAAVRRGVFASGLSAQEIKQIDQMAEFKNILNRQKIDFSVDGGKELVKRLKNFPLSLFRTMQKLTWWRENMMRYAAYLHYEELLRDGYELGPMEYGASRPEILEELTDHRDKAAMIARKTVGDYGDISHYGTQMREKAYPFWSWVEVNTSRYWRLGINAGKHNLGAGIATGTLIGASIGIKSATWLGLRTMAVYATVYLYNNLRYGDEEDDLSPDQRARLHINLGRMDNGSVGTVRFQGALSDFLDWVGFADVSDTIMEVESGRASWKDVWTAAWHAPVNKFVGGLTPIVKVPVEIIRGESWWPDVFHPRRVRDRFRYAAQLWALEHEYDALFNKPSKGYLQSLKTIAHTETIPGQSAYHQIQSAGYKWRERTTGKKGSSSFSTPRSEALYNYKLARMFKDKDAERVAKERIIELSKDRGDAMKAIQNYKRKSKPLAFLNNAERVKFKKTLSPEEKKKLKQAERWHQETF